jgi:hypothetical protein
MKQNQQVHQRNTLLDLLRILYLKLRVGIQIIRGAPLRWGYASVCCFATPDLAFDEARLQDLVPQFSQYNSDASSTVPDDPHGSEPEVNSDVDEEAISEWLQKALAVST